MKVGGPWGALIGAVVGRGVGIYKGIKYRKKRDEFDEAQKAEKETHARRKRMHEDYLSSQDRNIRQREFGAKRRASASQVPYGSTIYNI